jgi:hypothetical protein
MKLIKKLVFAYILLPELRIDGASGNEAGMVIDGCGYAR